MEGLGDREVGEVNNWAVGVCGYGRCGTTMLMSMLVAGGCPPGNAQQVPYEGDPAALAGRDLTGTAVKLLDAVLHDGIPLGTPRWRFVWLDRDPQQQALSHVKFLRTMYPVTGIAVDDGAVERFAASYPRDRPRAIAGLHAHGGVLKLRYESVLADPQGAAIVLAARVWPGLDVAAAAAAVHRRDGACRPDLAVELASIGEHPRGDS